MRFKISIFFLSLLLLIAPVMAGQNDSPAKFKFNEAQKANRFYDSFLQFLNNDSNTVPFDYGTLIIGSSTIGMWAWQEMTEDFDPEPVLKRGFGGSKMSDVLVFQNFFLRYKAARIVLYEGDNDIWDAVPPEEFLEQVKTFCSAAFKKRKDCEIFILSIKPSPSRWEKWPLYLKANELLKNYCETDDRLHYVDIVPPMLGDDGKPRVELFKGDMLHMNRDGYIIFRDALRKALELKPKGNS